MDPGNVNRRLHPAPIHTNQWRRIDCGDIHVYILLDGARGRNLDGSSCWSYVVVPEQASRRVWGTSNPGCRVGDKVYECTDRNADAV